MPEDSNASRRSSVRKKTLKEARVVLRDWSTINCIMRNLSDGGAALQFSDPIGLPETFDVLIVSTNMLMPARRVWEHGAAVGIQFTGAGRSAPPRKFRSHQG